MVRECGDRGEAGLGKGDVWQFRKATGSPDTIVCDDVRIGSLPGSVLSFFKKAVLQMWCTASRARRHGTRRSEQCRKGTKGMLQEDKATLLSYAMLA